MEKQFSTVRMESLRSTIRFGHRNAALTVVHPRGKDLSQMWKPTNQPTTTPSRPGEPERPASPTPVMTPAVENPAAPRPVASASSADQATIGKSLVIKGEVTGSESLYIDGRVEGSINLAGNRVTVGRNGVVSANINAREIVV